MGGSLRELEGRLRNITGQLATAEISHKGVFRSADIILGIESGLDHGTVRRSDLFRAAIAASQLVQRWSQLLAHQAESGIPGITDTISAADIRGKLSSDRLPDQARRSLRRNLFLADPQYGATTAMAVLDRLCAYFGTAGIQEARGSVQEGLEAE